LLRSLLDRAAPLLLAGVLLGIFQAGFACYRNALMITDLLTVVGILGGVMPLGVVWILLCLPWVALRSPGFLRGGLPVERVAPRAFTAAMQAALATAGWSAGWALAEPLEEYGLFAEGGMALTALVSALLCGLLATRLPRPSLRALRIGGIAAVVLMAGFAVASVPAVARVEGGGAEDLQAGVEAPDGAPDVILLTVDALRADHLRSYAATAPPTPELDRLAREGLRFARVVSPSCWTLPSLSAMHAALPVSRTGSAQLFHKLQFAARSPLASDIDTVAERFQAAGYRTAAIVGNPWASPFFGMNQGFQRFVNPSVKGEALAVLMDIPLVRLAARIIPAQRGDDRAEALVDQALAWLDEPSEAPLFLWIHMIDPHAPWEADPAASQDNSMLIEMGGEVELAEDGSLVGERFAAVHALRAGEINLDELERQRVKQLYAAEVRYVDQQTGRLMEALRRRPEPPLLAFTADHGEEFWEHGGFEHSHDYYREVTHIPLLLWWPGRVPAGQVVQQPVGLVDVGPSLLDLAGLQPPEPESWADGISLRGTWQGGLDMPARNSENNAFGLSARLLVEGPWRLILRDNGQVELYDVAVDPGEQRNLAYEEPEVVARMQAMLDEVAARAVSVELGAEDGPSAEVMEGLRALGYVE